MVGRFVPGGRSAAGALAGHLRVRWRRFALASVAGSLAWATSTVLLGRGASALVDGPDWQKILASVVVGLGISALLVGVHRVDTGAPPTQLRGLERAAAFFRGAAAAFFRGAGPFDRFSAMSSTARAWVIDSTDSDRGTVTLVVPSVM